MSQNDFSVANASGATVRADINSALQALATLSSGASSPSTTYAHQLWADTTSGTLKRRNAANGAWIVVRSLDEAFVLARSSNTMLDVSDIGKTIRATSSFTQTFDAVATLGDGWWVDYVNEGTGTITFDPNSSETIEGVTTIVFGPGESGRIVCNGSNLKVIGRSRYVGSIGVGRNITARTNSVTPNSQLDIDADELQLKDANGNGYVALGVNLTIDITASGANGLDTGAEGGSTWYYGWVIYNPASNTVAGLLSTSSTSPTMPSGYTFKSLVSAVRNDGSSNFIPFRQFGNTAYFQARQSVLSGGAATTETAVSVASAVPPIAHCFRIGGELGIDTSAGNADTSCEIRFVSGSDFGNADLRITGVSGTAAERISIADFELPNVSQQFYYIHTVAVGSGQALSVWVKSFKLPCGGE